MAHQIAVVSKELGKLLEAVLAHQTKNVPRSNVIAETAQTAAMTTRLLNHIKENNTEE